MRLYWASPAIQNREAIYEYIEADNPVAALAMDELFEEKASRLIDHPNLWRKGRGRGHAGAGGAPSLQPGL